MKAEPLYQAFDSRPLSTNEDSRLQGSSERAVRILFISNLFPDQRQPYRGLDNVTALHALQENYPCEIRVISPHPSLPFVGESSWQPRSIDLPFRPIYCKTSYVPKWGSRFNHHLMYQALKAPLKVVDKEFQWDVLLSSWLYPDGWAAMKWAREYRSSSVLIAQGSDVHHYLKDAKRKPLILEAVGGSNGVITRSKSLADLLAREGAEPAKLHPIHNGIDTQVFCQGDRTQARQNLKMPGDAVILLFVGNFLPVKDPLTLVKAFKSLSDSIPEKSLRLVMVGKGPLQKEIENLARSLGLLERLTFTGPLPSESVAHWMQAADFLCMTSRNEGLPNVVLEAQACGLPVIATDVGGIHEVVNEPNKGTLVPLGDLNAWIGAALEQIQHPSDREMILKIGQERNWRATTARYWEVLSNSVKIR